VCFTEFCDAVSTPPRANVNVDEQHIRSILLGASAFELTSATAAGPQRAGQVARNIITSLQLPLPLRPYGRALLAISSPTSAELQMDELTEIIETIQQQLGPETELIFGHDTDLTTAAGMAATPSASRCTLHNGRKRAPTPISLSH